MSRDLDRRPAQGGVRRLRRRRARPRRLAAGLLRPPRAPAPRPGERRHRRERRGPGDGAARPRPGERRLRRALAAQPHGRRGDRPRPLLHHRRQQVGQRPAGHPHPQRRAGRARPQRQPHQHRRAARPRWTLGGADLQASTDSEIIAAMLAAEPGSLLSAACEVMPRLVGAYSVVAMTGRELVAFRDAARRAARWCIGRLDGDGWCVASETCALDQIGATFERDVRPGRGRAPVGRAASRAARRSRRRAAGCACSSTSTSPAPTARWTARPCGRRAGPWAPSSPARARPRPTWWSACPTAARPPRSATPARRASPTPRRWCATATWGAASSSPSRRCASRASG